MSPIAATYRRFLLDLHVPDWDPRFLSEFDPDRFLDLVVASGAVTVTIPSNGHHGLAFYPSQAGPVHGGPGAAGILPRLLDGAAQRGLNRVVYHCLLYVDWYWDHHPEARITLADGSRRKVVMPTPANPTRFSVCCPNNAAYRDFARAQLAELSAYEFDGMNLDMMFWPAVCYCATCRARGRDELGAELPETVDWLDPTWVGFAAARRRWLEEFIDEITAPLVTAHPHADITHQSQMYTQSWVWGGSAGLRKHTAWLSADLYRSTRELSFDFKLFAGLSRRRPFEQISTWNAPDIHEHVLTRSSDELGRLAALAVMHDAALTVIDQPDPDGTVNEAMYPLLRPVFDRVQALEPDLGGDPVRDVNLYVSFESDFDFDIKPFPVIQTQQVIEPASRVPGPHAHRPAARQAAVALLNAHVPFGVITRNDLTGLDPDSVLVLSNVTILDAVEVAAIDAFVERGGGVYASGTTSLLDAQGGVREGFGLGCLGVRHQERVGEPTTYLAPTPAGASHFSTATQRRPLTLLSPQEHVEALPGTDVLATVTHAWTDPRETRYASTITNPPGRPTDWPALTRRETGAGVAIYAAGVLEAGLRPDHADAFVSLVRALLRRPFTYSVEAPDCIEVTVLRKDPSTTTVHLLNLLDTRPAVPVRDVLVRLRGEDPVEVCSLPDQAPMEWVRQGEEVVLRVPPVALSAVVRVRWR